ncbi:hypothetical protein LZ32DRAFT_256102 [Colletotrichum eremochloae]|nr:hypothetical protein LZ32DRAFT_256102 [Colletotrichum eremochloae]
MTGDNVVVDHLHGWRNPTQAKCGSRAFCTGNIPATGAKRELLFATRRGMSVAGEEDPVEMSSKQVECNDEPRAGGEVSRRKGGGGGSDGGTRRGEARRKRDARQGGLRRSWGSWVEKCSELGGGTRGQEVSRVCLSRERQRRPSNSVNYGVNPSVPEKESNVDDSLGGSDPALSSCCCCCCVCLEERVSRQEERR